MFKPGPFYMGDGWMGLLCNINCIVWTLFICVIFSLPTIMPVTPENMNYASVSGLSSFVVKREISLSIGAGYYRWCHRSRIVSIKFQVAGDLSEFYF